MTFKPSRSSRPRPTISTSALPDIVFMLLFFFMVVTVFRERTRLRIHLPQASELEYLSRKELINHIYIGPPADPINNASVAVQINDAFVGRIGLGRAIMASVRRERGHLRPLLITSLHVDGDVPMSIVTEVKTALRKMQQLKVNYAALPDPY